MQHRYEVPGLGRFAIIQRSLNKFEVHNGTSILGTRPTIEAAISLLKVEVIARLDKRRLTLLNELVDVHHSTNQPLASFLKETL